MDDRAVSSTKDRNDNADTSSARSQRMGAPRLNAIGPWLTQWRSRAQNHGNPGLRCRSCRPE